LEKRFPDKDTFSTVWLSSINNNRWHGGTGELVLAYSSINMEDSRKFDNILIVLCKFC